MAITETRYATKETDVRETNIGVDNINKQTHESKVSPLSKLK
jgi:hypothetical protein